MEMAKVTSKGQITIPVSIRRRLNINEGDKLLFIDSPDGVVMVNPDMLQGGQYEKAQPRQDAVAEPSQSYMQDIEPAQSLDAAEATEAQPTTEASSITEVSSITGAPSTPEASPAPEVPPVSEISPISETEPPPVANVSEEKKPSPQVQGLDLQSLLSEIRSIGRNI